MNIQSCWLEESWDRKKLLKGTIYTWAPSVLFTTLRRLSSKSLAVKVPVLKALPITVYPKVMHFRTVFEGFPFAWKKGLCKTVTCELIKSQRPLSSWMAFPLWHERGSLEAPLWRWPWRLGKCSPSDQTGLFSGVRTTLESVSIEKSRFAAVDQYFNRPHSHSIRGLLLLLWTAFHVERSVLPRCVLLVVTC